MRWQALRIPLAAICIGGIVFTAGASRMPLWQAFMFKGGRFESVLLDNPPALPPSTPLFEDSMAGEEWDVADAVLTDVTADGVPEWVLLVWRPWRDWPIQRWLSVPSPISAYHDVAGRSCHVIVLNPRNGHEIWAGSALPVPFVALAAGDVDGDGWNEVVTLEGDYGSGREGPASHVNVWRWNGFGFALEWRSSPGRFHQLRLTDVDDSGILDIVVR